MEPVTHSGPSSMTADDRKQSAVYWLVGKGYVLHVKVGRAQRHSPNPAKPKDW